VIRIIQVKDIEKPTKEDIDYSTIKGIPEEIAPDEIKRPDPYIIYTPPNPAPNETITFIAKDELRGKDIKSCKWDFGDETIDDSGKCEVSHSYSPFILWRYRAKATITYTDGTQRIVQKSFWVRPKIKLKGPEFIIPNLLIDETVNVAETPQNTPASVSLFKEINGLKLPIGIINVHFEKVGGNY
ncbi:PKD domain-containing protein, partial [bacterium]|nr:PKD domain-containing protein [bacterium]